MRPLLLKLLCLIAFAAPASSDAPRPVVFRTETMGTWASLTLVTADSAGVADLAYRSLVALHRVDSLMSNWTTTSDVAHINSEAAKGVTSVHPEVADVIATSLDISRDSDGAFDITVEPLVRAWGFLGGSPRVPSQAEIDAALKRVGSGRLAFDRNAKTIRFTDAAVRIDLGGIAKGWGVDRVADLLRANGVTDALIDLSGNMVALGNSAGHPGWNIAIRDPIGVEPYLATLRLSGNAVATSGDYEQFVASNGRRYGHIIDPRTGWSAEGLTSVTVVADHAVIADGWATALFVLGPEGARRVAQTRDDIAVVLVEPHADGAAYIWVESVLRDRFTPAAKLPASFAVRYF